MKENNKSVIFIKILALIFLIWICICNYNEFYSYKSLDDKYVLRGNISIISNRLLSENSFYVKSKEEISDNG
ncbi:hypothetical protein MKS88_000781 [Plasmodium brasilianum]|uniref:Uncharacterized protein n=1 Tax=Plasmodium brasilianum TaxID=5824 RepID=A0ACB9YFQ8_PLABR|nr:hypothetical protein MKS88_000781 [Plasmodium brasilianum]